MPDFQKEISALRKLNPKRKFALAAMFVALLMGGFLVGILISSGRNKVLRTANIFSVPSPTPAPSASLTISPSQKSLKVGEVMPVTVAISGEPVQAVDVVLTYDPRYFTASKIQKGKTFDQFLKQTIQQGKVSVSAAVGPTAASKTAGPGEIFTVNLTAIAATTSAQVSFAPSDTILAKNGENLLKIAVGGSYQIE